MAATNNKKGGMLLSLGGFIIFTGSQICLEISVFHCSGSSNYLEYLGADRKKAARMKFPSVTLPNFPLPLP